ncbi:hypothetical protein DAPPUDRAFT_320229 [Daphnia pulex]|uniref:XRN2-binding (XTBD) domain-containing protein n=1 Tax=Daphnia pulex TaxID=6669 RepID=E9GP92_DAPPU|nr:hypothetical protein DAPPUDRAFT_320229 [Daphnia pulex]|eukprot:EFX78722.1 hypothetical protein DAPPUDRAFT_320229 [Daphnia pulex]
MEYPPPIEDIRKIYEPYVQWNLRRAFIERNEEKMERRKLLKLSDHLVNPCFINSSLTSLPKKVKDMT